MGELDQLQLLRYARRYQNGAFQTQMYEEDLVEYCEFEELGDCANRSFDELIDTILNYQPKLPPLVVISSSLINFRRKLVYQRIGAKPGGLWASLENEWYDFVYGDRDNLKGEYIYQVELYPNVYTRVKRRRKGKEPRKIFICETLEDVEYVSQEYEPDDAFFKTRRAEYEELALSTRDFEDSPPIDFEILVSGSTYIDWKKFSERYAGIEVRNYNDAFRNHIWYSSFDVASLCVWDQRAVKDFTEVKVV